MPALLLQNLGMGASEYVPPVGPEGVRSWMLMGIGRIIAWMTLTGLCLCIG